MGVRNLAVVLTGDATSLGGALRQGSAQVQRFTSDVEGMNKRAVSSWKIAGAATASGLAAIAIALTGAGVAAAGFESRMRNVNSISGLSDAALGNLGDRVIDLSRRLPQDANNLAEGLYDIASSGFQGARGLTVLEASAAAASAGLTTTANAAKAITAVLNAYGLTASSATDVSDALFQTVNLGVVSFEELTGVIGDVAGTAAAAQVDVNQVGAAVATMTLSGISAAESGTSLNRVLQSLLQPSDALAAVFEQLGYESGATALKQKGLRGVLEDLRVATGGNITSLLQLFPEIRATRGALALLSNEGKTYTGVSKQIEDANVRHGATQRALDQQMRATSAQVRLIINGLRAEAIELGTAVLPAFTDFLRIARDLAGDTMPLLEGGVEALEPLFHALAGTGANVVEILVAIAAVGGPVAGALLAIVGAPVIGGLTLLAQGLEAVSGFLAENRGLVIALAATAGGVYLASMLASAAATVAFSIQVVRAIIATGTFNGSLLSLRLGAGLAMVSLRGLAASLLSLQVVATAGFAASLAVAGMAVNSWQQAGAAANAYVDSTTEGFNALKPQAAERTIRILRRTASESLEAADDFDGAAGTFRAGLAAIFGNADDDARKGAAAAAAALKLERAVGRAATNVSRLSAETGASEDAIVSFAIANNVDLSKPWSQLAPEIIKVRDGMADLQKQSLTATGALEAGVGVDIEALQAFSKAIGDAIAKASGAFLGATDVVAGFDPTAGLEAQQSATGRLQDAEQRLADLRARQRQGKKLDLADAQELRRAEEDVANARSELAEASTTRSKATLEAFYEDTLATASSFVRRVNDVTVRGLDPGVVTRLLQAGPEKAAPLLQAIARDHSGRLIELVNESERKLRRINTIVVEQARLTAIAVNSATDRNARNLSTAMQISQQVLASHGKATAEAIAESIGVPTGRVLQVAHDFGITLGKAIRAGVASVPLAPNVREQLYGSKISQVDRATRRNAGGVVPGQYLGPHEDNVLIRANPREYVMPVASVEHYGVDWMDQIRRRAIPRYASGGLVGGGWTLPPARATVVRVPMQQTYRSEMPVHVAQLVAHDYADFVEQLERRDDRRSSPGWAGL